MRRKFERQHECTLKALDAPLGPWRLAANVVHNQRDIDVLPLLNSLREIHISARRIRDPYLNVPRTELLKVCLDLSQFLRVATVKNDVKAADIQLLRCSLAYAVRGTGDESIGSATVYELVQRWRLQMESDERRESDEAFQDDDAAYQSENLAKARHTCSSVGGREQRKGKKWTYRVYIRCW